MWGDERRSAREIVRKRSSMKQRVESETECSPHSDAEFGDALWIEVVVLWGADVLSVSHVAAPAVVCVNGSDASDIQLPAGQLGTDRRRIAVASREQVSAVVPVGALGWLRLADGTRHDLQDPPGVWLGLEPSTPKDEQLLPIGLGSRVHLCFADIEIQIAPVLAARRVPRRWSDAIDVRMLGYLGVASALVGGLLFSLALLASLGSSRSESMAADQLHAIRQYIEASRQRTLGNASVLPPTNASEARVRPSALALDTPRRKVLERPPEADAPVREIPPDARRPEGLVGGERARGAQRTPAPSGSGGKAGGVPLNGIRTISNAAGTWPEGIPHQLGRITGGRYGGMGVWGSLSEPEVRHAIDVHERDIQACYEEERKQDPMLAGRVIMRFIVGAEGKVERLNTMGSHLPSKSVRRCLESLFWAFRFPKPASGDVTVTYPIDFSPSSALGAIATP